MAQWDDIQGAVESIRQRVGAERPLVGVVLGSGLGAFADRLHGAVAIPYQDITGFASSSVAGHAGTLVWGRLGDVPCVVMNGRVHYYEGHDLQRVTLPVRVLAGLGASSLLVTNAAGGINPAFCPGDLMVITDHMNLTGHNPLRGANDERLGPRFPDMSEAYGRPGRAALHRAAGRCGVSLREGVYAGLIGPSYETPAEIRMLQRLGADAVGMSTVAEVIVARHGGMSVAGLSVITNMAAGISAAPLSHDEVTATGNQVREKLCDVLAAAVGELAQ